MTLSVILPFVVAFVASAAIHPSLVRFARMKDLMDNPNLRKLQEVPIPVLGGLGVFFGITLGLVATCAVIDCSSLFVIFGSMLLMLYIGALDDALDISPLVRLVAQIVTVLVLIFIEGISLNNFHGLWGVEQLPLWANISLTLFAVVGIINAMNLIDGVDGLVSIFSITVCSIFAAVFAAAGNEVLVALAIATIGALIPFLIHNAFGKKSKMFVGDGGTLLLGVVLSAFVMEIDSKEVYASLFEAEGYSIVAFLFAVMAIPVVDTVRVMLARIIRRTSPLVGDKTHLHHLFVWLGISHVGTSILVVATNFAVILLWWASAKMGANADWQFYTSVFSAILLDCGIYYGVRLLQRLYPDKMERFREWKYRNKPNRRLFDPILNIIDRL